ncbi:MAG: Protein translocase subunit SecA [Candidatus Azambacteria bacterium GW2011_GWB2_46_37]|uniref:Protein translocase subunit SecA n=4 Tax=Candidatus Azamiibacteriota TaxID=1752741 RepID=A0A0G1SKY6_9BACT|nr:MAG: Protein translocase subunit SecA [Candidatus Azambacteria bacterium GW2011_GWB2_46_37]KKU42728.1 MAG: Protein translocase subunit SecA [Candidatus Azambacteria bacterium GW2011_GWD2_46_48]HAQ05768.1 preprotein translocase subunit SecA [Candidatus Azambacteria bacterium]
MFLSKLFGDPVKRLLEKHKLTVDEINKLEPKFEVFSFEELRGASQKLKERFGEGESLDDLLPEAFALARESAKRTLGQRHYDVQLIGGIVLHQGKIAEMKTGEGKTLVATLPAYLNALTGRGVHVVTVNDYLARRDAVWMGQIHHALGLSVSCINHEASYLYDPSHRHAEAKGDVQDEHDAARDTLGGFKIVHEYLRPCSRKEAYAADVLYGTNNEFGFDYLRDNMAYGIDDIVQREHYYAIVDEVDSILIDEARTPLIISAPDEESTKMYEQFSKIVPRLAENADYNIDEKMRAVSLTDEGIGKIEKILGVDNIYDIGGAGLGLRYVHHLEQALRANVLFKLDRDYVVRNGEVIIVDEFTGRMMPGRRYSEGLHQAIEAKEGVRVQRESRTLASITFQNYFRLYGKLAGMTGTAQTSAEEFHKVYNLEVAVVPTNKPMIRDDKQDGIYKTDKGKFEALVREIKKNSEIGRPVLVGTISIEKNERLSAMLRREGIEHELLNAKNHEREASIIAQAGRPGAVTIATNMAGRGVDIILGGNPPLPDEAKKVREAGGLLVFGTERHEARRIDNQLRGRAGRQGDPGASQFLVSLEDDLMRIFGSEKIKGMMDLLGLPEDQPIENKMISRALEAAQSKIEGFHFDARKHVLEYDDVMNRHREVAYKMRRRIADGSELTKDKISRMFGDEIKKIVEFHTQSESFGEWNIEEIIEDAKAIFSLSPDVRSKLEELKDGRRDKFEIQKEFAAYLNDLALKAYAAKEKEVGEENTRQAEKFILLRTLDFLWMDHLEAMEHLRSSVRLRAYGQRDPLVEYKNEGHRIFQKLLGVFQTDVVGAIFKVGISVPSARAGAPVAARPAPQIILSRGESESAAPKTAAKDRPTVGRNDPCPCGSGKKFKKCHGS